MACAAEPARVVALMPCAIGTMAAGTRWAGGGGAPPLQEAIARNPKLAPRAAQDPDLEPLRNTDAFKQIIGK
jgi:hypothetical protein